MYMRVAIEIMILLSYTIKGDFMKVIMDMGNTNTRMYLVNGECHVDTVSIDVGGRMSVLNGREFLFENLRGAFLDLLNKSGVSEKDVECVVAFGVAGSEYGIKEVLHIPLPADAKKLRDNMKKFLVPEFCPCPIYVIPGVMAVDECGAPLEIMRSEETEIMGLDDDIFKSGRTVVLLPGSHCKSITVDSSHTIINFISGMTGEMMQVLSSYTILSQKCEVKSGNDPEWQFKGAEWCRENGLNSALLRVRTLQSRTNATIEEISSFFVGAVIYPEIENIIRKNEGASFLVGGKKVLRELYMRMLSHYGATDVRELENAEGLGLKGAIKISSL